MKRKNKLVVVIPSFLMQQSFKKEDAKRKTKANTVKKKKLISKKDLNKYIPITEWLPAYKRKFLTPDLIAAITLTLISVPQAMAFAEMAGVSPVVGFYTLPLPLLAYAIFGSSRHIMAGPTSSGAILSFAVVSTLAVGDPGRFLALSAALAIISGIIFLIFGIAKLGVISNFISKPVVIGLIFGIAMVMIMGQIPRLLGTKIPGGNFFQDGLQIIISLPQTHGWTILIGATSLAILFLFDRFVPRAPAAIIVLIYGILLVTFAGLADKGVDIVGYIPSGLPKFGIPDIRLSDITLLIPGALGIVIVGFVNSLGAAKSFASKHKYTIDPNQELIAYGAANIGSGFSSGFTVDGSLSRSAASEKAGAKTQMTALISSALVLVIAMWLTPFFRNLPQATLAAIIIHAIWRMMNVNEMRRFFGIRKIDFWLAVLTLVGVLIFDILLGLVIAIIASVLAITLKASLPYLAILGKEPDSDIYSDIKRNPKNAQVEGLLIIRPDAQLFFANIEKLQKEIEKRTKTKTREINAVILSLESTVELDTDSIDTLYEIKKQLDEMGIELMLAKVYTRVHDTLKRSMIIDLIGQNNVFRNVNSAVKEYKRRYSVN